MALFTFGCPTAGFGRIRKMKSGSGLSYKNWMHLRNKLSRCFLREQRTPLVTFSELYETGAIS